MIRTTLVVIFLLSLSMITESALPPLDETIGQAIFHESQAYLIYVSDTPKQTYLKVFQEYCGQDKLCTTLDGQMEMHRMISQFVRMDVFQYLLILNSATLQKFTMPLSQSVTVQQIQEFHQKFIDGKLERHFSSEYVPTEENDPYLRKIVGTTFQTFVEGSQKVKVLYLYSDDQGCSICKIVYDLMVKAAKAFPDRAQVNFGAMDLFRNQHKLLHQYNIPVVLVYTTMEDKLRLQEISEIEKLEEFIQTRLRSQQEINEQL